MTRSWIGLSVLLMVACNSTDDRRGDAGRTDAGGDRDAGQALDAPTTGDAAGTDAGMLECFGFSLDPDLPDAIDGTFDALPPRWRRPHDDPAVCPATMLTPMTAADVPYVVYAFCNNDSIAHTFDFEMLAQDGPTGETPLDDPYLFLYTGVGIPTDPLQCLAANDDIPDAIGVSDSEITGILVPPGGAITVVGTTFTFDPSDGTGTGYYILVATNAD